MFEIFLSFLHVYFKIKFGFRRSKYPWRISFILCQKILFVTFFFFESQTQQRFLNEIHLRKPPIRKEKKKKLKCKEFPSFDGEVEACCFPRKKRNRKRDFLFERFYSGPAVVDIFFFAVPYCRVNPIKRHERAATHDDVANGGRDEWVLRSFHPPRLGGVSFSNGHYGQ